MKRKLGSLLLAVMMVFSMMFTSSSLNTNAAESDTYLSNGGSYDLEYILNKTNIFTSGTIRASHVYGPLIAGGDAGKGNDATPSQGFTFSDYDQGFSSYIGGKILNGQKATGNNNTPAGCYQNQYVGTVNTVSAEAGNGFVNSNLYMYQNTKIYRTDSYVDFDAAFQSIQKQSNDIYHSTTKTLGVDDLVNGYLYITEGQFVKISDELAAKGPSYTIVLVTDSEDASNAKNTAISYGQSGELTMPAIHVSTAVGEPGKLYDSSLELNTKGTSLIWNCPNAKKITYVGANGNGLGHTVAPQADIYNYQGTYSGCQVCRNFYGNYSEAHMQPYNGTKIENPEKPTTVNLVAHKTLNNQSLKDGQFKFELKDDTGKVLQTVSNVGDTISFDTLSYTTEGTYHYTISEKNEGAGGITYDKSVYNVDVVVTYNFEKDLYSSTVTTHQVVDQNGASLTSTPVTYNDTLIQFNNTYHASGSLTLTGNKAITGRNWLDSDQFTILLKDGNSIIGEKTVSKDDVNFSFPINYTEANIGEHHYTLEEKQEKTAGLTYDTHQYAIDVTVSDNGDGTLATSTKIDNGSANQNAVVTMQDKTFNNTYGATGEIVLSSSKVLTGETLKDQEFSFALKSGTTTLQTVSNDEQGNISFSPITYTSEGTYTYTVSEVNDGKDNITYDGSIKTIRVVVVDNNKGSLVPTITVDDQATSGYLGAFTNTVKKGSVTLSKTLSGKAYDLEKTNNSEATFNLYKADNTLVGTYTTSNGSLSVDNLTFGSYYFKETKAPNNYDLNTNKINFEVNKDNYAAGVTTTCDDTRTQLTTNISLGASKVLTGGTLKDQEFSFALKSGTTTLQTVSNDEQGNISFSPITYTSEGTYTYTVSEVNDGKDNITYDGSIKTIRVVVVDNNKGSLVPTITVDDQATSGYLGAFTNTVKKGSVTLSKTLSGKAYDLEKTNNSEATFNLYKADNTLVGTYTTSNGSLSVDNLTFGSYYFKETKAPNNYDLNTNKINFEVNKDNYAAGVTTTCDDALLLGQVELKKCNEDGQWLEKAIYGVYSNEACEESTLVTRIETDAQGHGISTELKPGTYYVKEISAPQGYTLDTTVYKTIIKGSEVTVVNSGKGYVQDDRTHVSVDKKDQDGKYLAGATLAIYDLDGKMVTSWVSEGTSKNFVGQLIAGQTYVLKELEAPEGYELAKPITFTVDAYDSHVTAVTMTDQKISVKVPTTKPKKPKKEEVNTVSTGDDTQSLYYVGLLVFSLLAMGYGRKKVFK